MTGVMKKKADIISFELWPEEYRARFESVFSNKSASVQRRLKAGFGKWLSMAEASGTKPNEITATLVSERSESMSAATAQFMRLAKTIFVNVSHWV